MSLNVDIWWLRVFAMAMEVLQCRRTIITTLGTASRCHILIKLLLTYTMLMVNMNPVNIATRDFWQLSPVTMGNQALVMLEDNFIHLLEGKCQLMILRNKGTRW